MAYEVVLKPSAQKDLDALPDREVERLVHRIALLAADLRPIGCQKLANIEGYRIRSGSYRVLYVVDDASKKISIYRIKHRRDAYR